MAVTTDSDVTAATPLPPAVSCPPDEVLKPFFSIDLSVEDIDRQLDARRELLVRENGEKRFSSMGWGSFSAKSWRGGSSMRADRGLEKGKLDKNLQKNIQAYLSIGRI